MLVLRHFTDFPLPVGRALQVVIMHQDKYTIFGHCDVQLNKVRECFWLRFQTFLSGAFSGKIPG